MRKLSTKPNTVTPGGDYPYGRIKDDTAPGAKNGTPISEQVYGDFHQFFDKLMADAGITPNNLPENTANGFQLNQALDSLVGRLFWTVADTTPTVTTTTGGATVTFHSSPSSRYQKLGKTLRWVFYGSITTTGSPTEMTISIPTTFQFPSALASATGLVVIGKFYTKLVSITIYETSVEINTLDGTALPNITGGSISFSVQFEIQ